MAVVRNNKDMAKTVGDSMDSLGSVELSGIKLETADPKLLDIGQMDLDRHVAMQPAAIAYYGALKKEAARQLAVLKRSYDRWEKKQLGKAKVVVYSRLGSKTNVSDVEAQFLTDNEKEIEKWDAMLDKAQYDFDTLEVWYEAWRQKSFALREHVSMDNDEGTAPDSLKGGDCDIEGDVISKIREIIRTRQVQGK